jgi:hypothetical protein
VNRFPDSVGGGRENEAERGRLVRYSARSRRIAGRTDSKASVAGISGEVRVVLWLGHVNDWNAFHAGQLLRRFAPSVAMVQATESRHGGHVCGRGRLRFDAPFVRCILCERVVNTVLMVVAHVITHEPE